MLSMLLAWLFTAQEASGADRALVLAGYWEKGLWNGPLMVFAMQMMLMLVLGHMLALSKPFHKVIAFATRYCTDTARAAYVVTLLTILVSLFNWGLGLVFGAILARKVAEHAAARGFTINYPLIGAAGYSGMMVWHGGISGSAPIKAAEAGHIHELLASTVPATDIHLFPASVSFYETIFSPMNMTVTAVLIVLLPLLMYVLGRKWPSGSAMPLAVLSVSMNEDNDLKINGAERLDRSRLFILFIGMAMLAYALHVAYIGYLSSGSGFISPNYINLLLLALGFTFHRHIIALLSSLDSAISGASGILIQFPLYFGIMGVMSSSGLAQQMADFFVQVSSAQTFPLLSMFSAGIVNIFVPSGGGQWSIQGPILLDAAMKLGVDIPKSIMALAYGDQLTNMLQPFWALPLLGITGLKAKEILPYALMLMLAGTLIFGAALIFF